MTTALRVGTEFATHTQHERWAHAPHRIRPMRTFLFIALTVFMMSASLFGQKQWKDPYVSIAVEDQINPSIAYPTQEGYTVTVWEDERHAVVRGADIYIQKTNNETGVSEWVDDPQGGTYGPWDVVTERFDGIPVCRADGEQRNPRAAYDGLDGVIIVWEDYRNDPTGQVADIYAQRIDLTTGRPDPTWPTDGIAVCQTGYHSERPRIAGTVDGAFISWIDYRNDPGIAPYDRDIYLQYINSTTATWPPAPTSWVANGIPVATNQPPDQLNPELAVDNIFVLDMLGRLTQGVVVTYQDNRYPSASMGTPTWTVFANRIDANGLQMYTMGLLPFSADVAAAPSFESQELPRLVTTGAVPQAPLPSAVIVWQDAVENPALGYTDIYSQRLDQFGNALFAGTNGLAVCQASLGQTTPIPVLWESGDPSLSTYIPYVTVGWEDQRNVLVSGIDLYGSLIDATAPGMIVNPQGVNGEPICTLPYDQTQLSMDNLYHTNSTQEYSIFVWTHQSASGKDIRCQKVMLPPWLDMWTVDGKMVTEAKSDQILPQANREVFVWQDGRRDPIPNDNQDDENIFCQTPGICTGPTDMKWRDRFAKWTYGRDAREFRFAVNQDDGSTFVVWTEDREVYPGTWHSIVFVQKLDKDGVPRWSNNGIAVNGYTNTSYGTSDVACLPDVCIANNGGAFVVWQQSVYLDPVLKECPGVIFDAAGGATPMMHSWTWQVNPGPLTTSFTEPRIVARSAGAAAFAALEDLDPYGTSNVVPWVAGLTSGGGVTVSNGNIRTDMAVQVTDNVGLMLVTDDLNSMYTLSRSQSTSQLVLGGFDAGATPQYDAYLPSQSIPYVALDSYDLSIQDYISSGYISAALFTYSAQTQVGNPYDIYAGYYRWNGSTRFFYSTPVTINLPGLNSRQPAICADSVYSAGSGEQGILLAWDTDYQYPGYPLYHRVETNRYRFLQSNFLVPEFLNPFVLASGLSAPTYPDVARVPNSTPSSSTRGVVVWEGGGELGPCSPARPTEIYGQYVFYDNNAVSPGPQWTQAEMIGPGVGNYHQTAPNIWPAGPDAVSVFWFDDQTGNDGIMGTVLPNLNQSIAWAKNRDTREPVVPDCDLRIADVWPQPAHAGSDVLHITVSGAENQEVVLELFDALGRRSAHLFEGMMWQSGLTLRVSLAELGLRPGMYMLRYGNRDNTVTKPITLLR